MYTRLPSLWNRNGAQVSKTVHSYTLVNASASTRRTSVAPLSADRVASRNWSDRSNTHPVRRSVFFRSSVRSPVEIFTL